MMTYSTPEVKTLNAEVETQSVWFYLETVAVVALALIAVVSQVDITP